MIEAVDTVEDEELAAELAAGWLAELRHDPARAIWGMQLTLGEVQDRGQQWLADLAMRLSEDPRRAEPEALVPGGAYCDHCGRANPADLDLSNPDELSDRPCRCHGMVVRHCKDTDACSKRREERYPPDLDRVPGWVFDAQHRISMEEAARPVVRAAVAAAARGYLELAAAEDEEEAALALSGPAWWGDSGAYDVRGGWHPAPQLSGPNFWWKHTIRGGAGMGHALSGGARYGWSYTSPGRQQEQEKRLEQAQQDQLVAQEVAQQEARQDQAEAPQKPASRTYRDRYGNRRVKRGRRLR